MAVKKIPYTKKELTATGPLPILEGERLNTVSFPIGGIGTGCIGLSGRGELIDWQIFNRPSVANRPGYTFFSVWAKKGKEAPVFRVLEGQLAPPYDASRYQPPSSGPEHRFASGLPRVKECRFKGEYPFGEVEYRDPAIPLQISIEGWNPFIPTNGDDSSIPTAIFYAHVRNNTRETVKATVALNVQNFAGWPEIGQTQQEWFEEGGLRGISMTSKRHKKDSPRYGTLALTTPWKRTTHQLTWLRAGWFDSLTKYVNTFAAKGKFDDDMEVQEPTSEGHADTCSLGLQINLKPGQSARLPFILTWNFPWHERYWRPCCEDPNDPNCKPPKWKNYYATLFKDALDAAVYVHENLERLEEETRSFHQALFKSSLPTHVLEAVSSQMSILKTPTCLRLEDGTFYGWEGCTPSSGCCEGTCTHVWNYAQALPFLFPALERSNRTADYQINLRESDGHMQFRLPLPLGEAADHGFHAAADGQLGGMLKTYRDWLVSGDDEQLRKIWPEVKKALEYAWVAWDKNKDGLITETHHNTYDIEFHGAEPMAQTFYLGALRAAEELARYLGEDDKADEYRKIFESGKKKTEQKLWNGEYFQQRIPKGKSDHYQYGKGCLSDMVIGQWFATMVGLGDLLDPKMVKSSLKSIFKYNWRDNLEDHINPQRVYALNDEAGLLLCSWPQGSQPPVPFVYSNEVWCGIEYQVASHLIYEGLVEEGLAVVKGVRDRHDGIRRNPWNEFECGNYYARSMASWAVLLALSGFLYNTEDGRIRFDPRVSEDNFQCFFSVDSGWGVYSQKKTKAGATVEIEVLYGDLKLSEIDLNAVKKWFAKDVKVTLDRRKVEADYNKGVLTLEEDLVVEEGMKVTVKG